jgi:hypothetical protein
MAINRFVLGSTFYLIAACGPLDLPLGHRHDAGSPHGGQAGKGGSNAGGSAGSNGGGSGGASGSGAGGAGDAGGCIDVCRLYGQACCVPALSCVKPGGSCVIDVLAEYVDTTYEYAVLEQKVASMPQDLLASFTDADIAWAAAEPPPAARIELHMTPRASALYGTILERPMSRPFRLSCNGQRLFVGVIYLEEGAAALRTPVLHVARDSNEAVVLRLGAWQGAWMGFGWMDDSEARRRIDRAELRSVFCQRGALRELDP